MSATFHCTLSEQGAANSRSFVITFRYSVRLKYYLLRCNINNLAVWRKLLLFVSWSSYINICGNRYQNRDFGRHVPYFIEKETHNLPVTVVICRALLLRIWSSHVLSLSRRLDDAITVTALWNMMSCSLIQIYRDFGGTPTATIFRLAWHVPLNHWQISTKIHGVISTKNIIFIVISATCIS